MSVSVSDSVKMKNQRAIEALRNGVPNRDAVAVLGCVQPEIERKLRDMLERIKNEITGDNSGNEHSDCGNCNNRNSSDNSNNSNNNNNDNNSSSNDAGNNKGNSKKHIVNNGMLVAGDFGSGKSHLLEYLMHLALEQKFVCSRIVISKETPLYDPIKLYRAAIEAAVVPGKRGSAVTEIAAMLKFNDQNYRDFYLWAHKENNINARFAATLFLYERMSNDPELSNHIIRFWSGDRISVGGIRKYLKACSETSTYRIDNIPARELALQSFKFNARMIAAAGYSGWILLIDEAELIGRYSILQRAKSYAELARFMGKYSESASDGLATIFAITEDFQRMVLEGRDDFEKIPNKLRAKRTEGSNLLAKQAEAGMKMIQDECVLLNVPDKNILDLTYGKVKDIYKEAYGWDPPHVKPYGYMATTRMRQYIKGWITEWDLRRLYPDYSPELESMKLSQDYTEDKSLEVDVDESTDAGSLQGTLRPE